MMGDKVVPIRSGVSEPPTSVVMRVARKASGSAMISPVEALRREYRANVDRGLQAYDGAAAARKDGDHAGAAELEAFGDGALDRARAIGVEIARL